MTLTFDYITTIEKFVTEAVCREWVEASFQDLCLQYNCIACFKTCTITGKEEDLKKILLKLNQ